jgi:hypothetical protein
MVRRARWNHRVACGHPRRESARRLAVGLPRDSIFLQIPRLSYVMIPKAGIAIVLAAGVWIVIRKRYELIYLWCLGLAEIMMSNSQLITGLELHNGHWSYMWGPMLTTLVVIIVVSETRARMSASPRVVWAAAGLLGLYGLAGFYLRAAEATLTNEGVDVMATYARLEEQGAGSLPLISGAVIAGEEGFCELAVILKNQHPLSGYAVLQSASTSDAQWEARMALNGWLLGFDRPAWVARANQMAASYPWGPWAFGESSRSELAQALIDAYDTVSCDPATALDAYRVRYVALPARSGDSSHVREGWRVLQAGRYWKILERPGS